MDDFVSRAWQGPCSGRRAFSINDVKMRQSCKLREIGEALVVAGVHTLDHQAKLLGLSRSTTWTIVSGSHKSSGLSAAVINRILAKRGVAPPVRAKVLEYVEEKAAGCYGHNKALRLKFVSRLSADCVNRNRLEKLIDGKSINRLYQNITWLLASLILNAGSLSGYRSLIASVGVDL